MMAATPTELEYQTMTSVGKVSVTDDSTAILLGLIGFSATLAHESGKWQISLPHLRTESAVALSSCRA